MKRFTALLIIISFVTLAFFSATVMTHGQHGDTKGDCPFSGMGVPLCAGDKLAVAFHHVSLYHSFFNVLVGWDITASIMLLLVALSIALVLLASPPTLRPRILQRSSLNVPPDFHDQGIVRWLSLLKNSPPF